VPLRLQIFTHVRGAGRAARADITRALGVSAGSVTPAVAELIAMGLLREVEEPARDPGRDGARGRPPVALEVVPGTRPVVGVKLGADRHTAVLTDLSGAMLAEAALPASAGRRPAARLLDETAALIDRLLAAAGRPACDLAGLGLGLAGLVDHHAGRVAWSPLLTEREVDLRAFAEARFGLPVQIDNDANLLTLAELWFGAGRATSDFVVVTIEQGVGMGLVLGGRLMRGTRGMGMELGHTKVALDGALCRCGRRGCLEAYVADYALAREAATALALDRPLPPAQALEALFAAARAGDGAAREIFDRARRYLALGLSNVVQIFDPALIILSGERMRYDYLCAEAVIAEMAALGLPQGRPPARVEVHAWGDLAWARGAAALALAAVTEALLG
jgi:predicted NBD/HSP70 family sugar kinase